MKNSFVAPVHVGLLLLLTLLAIPISSLLVSDAYAEAYCVPDGPWIRRTQYVSRKSLLSNEELGRKLHQIEARSNGLATLSVAGYSNLGWPLYVVKIGCGETKVLITTQIHGGEPLGTEAAINLIQYLAKSGNLRADMIREHLTVWIMPRVNPDGAQFFRRGNIQEWDPNMFGLPEDTPYPWYYYRSTRYPTGFDINRDFNPDLEYQVKAEDIANNRSSRLPGFYVTPEARAIRDTFKQLRPKVFVDIHHQGYYYMNGTNEGTMLSISAKVCEGVKEEQYEFSKKINVVVYQALSARGNSVFNTVTRYGTVNLPGSSLGSFALNDVAIMLFEVRNVGQKSSGHLTQLDQVGVLAVLKALASGEVHDTNSNLYYTIPAKGYGVRPPWLRDDE